MGGDGGGSPVADRPDRAPRPRQCVMLRGRTGSRVARAFVVSAAFRRRYFSPARRPRGLVSCRCPRPSSSASVNAPSVRFRPEIITRESGEPSTGNVKRANGQRRVTTAALVCRSGRVRRGDRYRRSRTPAAGRSHRRHGFPGQLVVEHVHQVTLKRPPSTSPHALFTLKRFSGPAHSPLQRCLAPRKHGF